MPDKLPEAFGHDAESEAEAREYAQMAVEELMQNPPRRQQ
jgi:hypothetical protein